MKATVPWDKMRQVPCAATCAAARDGYCIGLLWSNTENKHIWLVVSNMNFIYFPFHIWDVILPIDELIFFKIVKTTNQIFYVCLFIPKWICIPYSYVNHLHCDAQT